MPLSFPAIQAGVYRSLRLTAPATAALLTLSVNAHAEAPSVVTSIKPLHSIAAAVMEGVGTPYVLIDSELRADASVCSLRSSVSRYC